MKHAGETYSQSRNDRRITVKIGAVNEYAQETGQMGGREQAASSQQEQGRAAGNFLLRGNQAFDERRDYQQGQGGQRRPEPAQMGRGSTARVPVAARRRGPSGPAALLAGLAALAALALLLPALLAGRAGDTPPPPAQGSAAAVQTPMRPGSAPGAALAQQPEASAPGGGSPDASGVAAAADTAAATEPTVRVYLKRTGQIETLPLEQYVTGVLAAEMPADFELAALKAQAIAARTFIVRRLAAQDTSGVPGGKADVLDTVDHQAYLPTNTLEKWEKQGKSAELGKLKRAVSETRGIVMTYQGKPITASFFSASGGYTENSEEYWSLKIPYLRSVPSPWDAQVNSENQETVTIPVDELYQKLGQAPPAKAATAPAGPGALKASSARKASAAQLTILSHTTGGRVKEIKVGEKSYSGREFREKLGLRSSQFTVKLDGVDARITTYGYGHGVGMSQWGANGMAKQGYTTTQILRHYYTGIAFQQAEALLE
ncbi:hypothetical protein J41TS12_01050 [Paenibacillus antibioticophila]|uniref:Sporulation stage II protein D amidase enhancer LytB N-terminal domain-containing protein n=1 Tax=Paenibacillus antibioticophila TaxID=1274374 RepID=A0A920CFP8_9BACL|nr:stage II sporulation protein D [Paenibacillus antibioticophila]GIO35244.1 hypothetical protein J41TS12_01050 [Paenibacillus antibioticophila]